MTAVSDTLLTDADDVGAGSAVDLTGASDRVTMSVTSTGVAALVVHLEGSVDGTNFFKLGEVNGTSGAVSSIGHHVVTHVRARISTLTASDPETPDPKVSAAVAALVDPVAEEVGA